jgi:hypothetical protein
MRDVKQVIIDIEHECAELEIHYSTGFMEYFIDYKVEGCIQQFKKKHPATKRAKFVKLPEFAFNVNKDLVNMYQLSGGSYKRAKYYYSVMGVKIEEIDEGYGLKKPFITFRDNRPLFVFDKIEVLGHVNGKTSAKFYNGEKVYELTTTSAIVSSIFTYFHNPAVHTCALTELFNYEGCNNNSSMFDNFGVQRAPTRSHGAMELKKFLENRMEDIEIVVKLECQDDDGNVKIMEV